MSTALTPNFVHAMADKIAIFTSSMARRWALLVADDANDVLILSPYLTPKVAEQVIRSADIETAKIYTTFSVEVFAAGASSLETVKNFVSTGYRIYRVDGLHAKVVLAGQAVSIGSQNLTGRGARNFEVSTIIRNRVQVAALRRKIIHKVRNAELVTLDHIKAIEPLVKALRKDHAKFKKSADDAATQFNSDLSAILQEKAERLLVSRRLRERSSIIRRSLKRMRVAGERVRVQLKQIYPSDDWSLFSKSYLALTVSARSTLLRWQESNGQVIRLSKTQRYLMIHAETGRLCWPAVFKSQISKVSGDLKVKSHTFFPGSETVIRYELLWDAQDLQTRNVRISIICSDLGIHRVLSGYFSIANFNIVDIDDRSDPSWRDNVTRTSGSFARGILSLADSEKRLSRELRNSLLESFKFEKNGRNRGLLAFLGDSESREFWVEARKIDGKSLLILSDTSNL